MKRMVIAIVAVALVAGSVTTVHAKGKMKRKPVPTTFYLHGVETLGEVDLAKNSGVGYNVMDATEPTDDVPKSITPVTWAGDEWNDCVGSYLLPVWTGLMSGRVVGDISVTLHTAAASHPLEIQVWDDVDTQGCADNYVEPEAMTTVTVPAGPGVVEAVIEDVDFGVDELLMLQLRPVGGPFPGRFLYDAADLASAIELSCIPARGKTSCV
jgi:hypothetical protein